MGFARRLRAPALKSGNLARVGPTTPTRARRLADASVDPTAARNDILGYFADFRGRVTCLFPTQLPAQSDRISPVLSTVVTLGMGVL